MKTRILSLFLILCLSLTLLPGAAAQEIHSGTCGASGDNLIWAFHPDTGLLEITGSGDMCSYGFNGNLLWDEFRPSIKALSLPEGLRTIGDQAFSDCVGLTEVTVPEGVTRVGERAFSECSGLREVKLPQSVNSIGFSAFIGCTGLTSFTVPPGVTRIRHGMLANCANLTEVIIPEGVTALEGSVFLGCTGLRQLTLPQSLREIGIAAFSNCGIESLALPEGVTKIPEEAFYQCKGLTRLTLPASLTRIEAMAFFQCEALTELTIPAGVEEIHRNAFRECGGLKRLIFRNPACYAEAAIEFPITDGELMIRDDGAQSLGLSGKTELYSFDPGPELPEIRRVPASGKDQYFLFRTLPSYAEYFGYRRYALGRFRDVGQGKFYELPVAWAVGEGITNGTGEGLFSPNKECTRAQVVTFLWRAAGSPDPASQENPFTDVPMGKSYSQAVLWAVEQGITSGTSDTTFSPNKACTRAQVVTFLWRYAGEPEPASQDNPFADVPAGKSYTKAVLWAVERGVTNGTSATQFSPNKTCTRGQVVTFLYRVIAE